MRRRLDTFRKVLHDQRLREFLGISRSYFGCAVLFKQQSDRINPSFRRILKHYIGVSDAIILLLRLYPVWFNSSVNE